MTSSAAAAVAEQSVVPIAASAGSRHGKWRQVEVGQSVVCMTGGFSRTYSQANSIELVCGISNTKKVFVQLEKNSHWFLKAVGGPGTQKGELKVVEVMEDIRLQFERVVRKADCNEPAVAEQRDACQIEEVDPMDALDEVAASEFQTPVKGEKALFKKRQVARRLRSEVQQLEMPTRPVCAGRPQDGMTSIHVYRKPGSTCRNFGNLYLRTDCLDWLLSYAADELYFQGVTRPEPELEPLKGNCPAVADVYVEWNFSDQSWDAQFLAGEHAGTKKRFFVADLTSGQWNNMKRLKMVTDEFYQANRMAKKSAAKDFMVSWCKAIESNDGLRFETEWGLRPSTEEPLVDSRQSRRKKCRTVGPN